MGKLLAFVGVVALIGVAFYVYKGNRHEDAGAAIEQAVDDAGDAAADVADDVTDAADDIADDVTDADGDPDQSD